MPPKPSRRRCRFAPRPAVLLPLEPRVLFAGDLVDPSTLPSAETVETAIPPVLANLSDPTSQTVDLRSYVYDPYVPGTVATFEFNAGNIVVALDDQATPVSVANFLTYVDQGTYNDTVIHRSAYFDGSEFGVGASPTQPATIVQGGGYVDSDDASVGLRPITASNAPIENFEAPVVGDGFSNVTDTIAFANTGNPDSVTTGWFFNNSDNSSTFDQSYTAFGHIIGGADVLTSIATRPTTTSIKLDGQADTQTPGVPIVGLTSSQVSGNVAIGPDNLVTLYGIATQAGTTYTVKSSNPGLVAPTVSGGVVSFKYGTAGAGGTATVTVTATSGYDNSAATTSFAVTVPPASTTATGPITAADTVPAAVTGQATLVHVLANDTDGSDSALNPASVTPVGTANADGTYPTAAGGTVTVDATTGDATYTSPAGYTGADSFQYTVADAAGTRSAATTVNITVVPTPTSVVIGNGSGVSSVVFTQPDGTQGRLTVTGAKATVTFSPGTTTETTAGGVATVTGAGATIADVAVVNAGTYADVTLATVGKGSVTLGGLTDTGLIDALNLGTATVTGTVTAAGVNTLALGTAVGATLNLGSAAAGAKLTLGTVTDTSLTAGVIRTLRAKSFTVDDGGAYEVSASAIATMVVPGGFGDVLEVTSTSGYAITSATVGGASAPWFVSGGIFKATLVRPTGGWGLRDGSLVRTLTVQGDLLGGGTFQGSGNVIAAAIDTVNVTGAMTNATIQTDGLVNRDVTQMQRVTIAGAMTNSVVYAAGNIGTVSAASMSGSKVYAGVNTSLAGTATLPSGTTDLSAEATIASLSLRSGKSTFVNSEVAAYKLGTVSIGKVTTDNSSTAFGISAHTVGAIVANLNGTQRLALTPQQTKSATTLSAYLAARKISTGDFTITIY